MKIIFVDRTSLYAGGMTPVKFRLVVNAPNNSPYLIKPQPTFVPIDFSDDLDSIENKIIYVPLP